MDNAERVKVAKLMAIVPYDLFPYFVCHPVSKCDERGNWESCGMHGYWWKPALLLPVREGRKFEAKLQKLKKERRAEEDAMRNRYNERLDNELLKPLGIKRE